MTTLRIDRAWRGADLSWLERASVFLVHGVDMTKREAARTIQVAPSTVHEKAYSGVITMKDYMNGRR